MTVNTTLSKQELMWITECRVSRLSDNKEVQIYPMGAERYLATILAGYKPQRYNLSAQIKGKRVLVIPGHGNNGFLFAEHGAKSVTVYDKDPVTIAWMKAFKKYYYYRGNHEKSPSIGELLNALTCWYPPLIKLPKKNFVNTLFWAMHPNSLRRAYIHYMLALVQDAIHSKTNHNFELEHNLHFHQGTIDTLQNTNQPSFDTVFVPYLLGVRNGIEKTQDIVCFLKQLTSLGGTLLVTPSRDIKEFYIAGQRYFVTTGFNNIQDIPALKNTIAGEDKLWFHTQGLAIFKNSSQ